MRVVSLLPAATEILAALGMLDQLVGVSHECDYPLEAQAKPRVTRCAIHGGALASEAADRWVSDTLAGSGTLYTLDEALIRRLEPDVLITQRLCDVCAVGYGTVTAFAATLPGPPHVINLDPSSVGDVLQDIRTVGAALGVAAPAAEVIAGPEARIAAVVTAVRAGEVYAVDGSAYFSRPGPRLVDSLEMLAEILHPELFAGRFPARAVRRLAPHELAAG